MHARTNVRDKSSVSFQLAHEAVKPYIDVVSFLSLYRHGWALMRLALS